MKREVLASEIAESLVAVHTHTHTHTQYLYKMCTMYKVPLFIMEFVYLTRFFYKKMELLTC